MAQQSSPPQSPLFVPTDEEREAQASNLAGRPDSEYHTAADDASRQSHIQRLLRSTNPEQLERAVEKVKEFLQPLQQVIGQLRGLEKESSADWMQDIETLLETPASRLVIGFVGNSGHGKSSAINALLDMPNLLSTSNSSACTAVATEISWNPSDDEDRRFWGVVEYISSEDWRNELQILARDLLNEDGELDLSLPPNSDAKIALDKIHTVYGYLERDKIAARLQNIDEMVRDDRLRLRLGTVEEFSDRNATGFRNKLQRHINSANDLWPLVKVVKIYVKAPVLKFGVVFVDLPGAQDSNAARSAVAANYIKQCASIWVFSDIVRAATDKTANDLWDESFRRHLVLDGMCSAVTFICTKTDIIDKESALSEYDDPTIHSKEHKRGTVIPARIGELKKERKGLPKKKKLLKKAISQCKRKIQDLQALLSADCVPVAKEGRKRKPDVGLENSRKRRHRSPSCIDSQRSFDTLSITDVPSRDMSPSTVLSKEEIREEIESLRNEKDQHSSQLDAVDEKIQSIDNKTRRLEAMSKNLDSLIRAALIKARNEKSKSGIRQQFADLIRETDQETAIERRDSSMKTSEPVRDYEAIAGGLPVFCVSSVGYQKLNERPENDRRGHGVFNTVEDTGIPQLRDHCHDIADSKRATALQHSLLQYSSLATSLTSWARPQDGGQGEADSNSLPMAVEGFKMVLDSLVIVLCTSHLTWPLELAWRSHDIPERHGTHSESCVV
jgi:hypothetical protein